MRLSDSAKERFGVKPNCLVVAYFIVLILLPAFCWADWVILNSGITTNLNSVFFINSSTGWAVGNSGVILKTTNGGANWGSQTSGTTTILRDVYFLNASTGLAVGNDGIILKTINGGTTWFAVSSGINDILYSIFWIAQNNVWTVGQLGKIRKSSDGGNTFSNGAPNGTPSNNDLRSVFFINTSTGWAGGNNGNFWITRDTGTTWTATSASGLNLRQIFFVNDSTGFAALSGTAQGQVWKTTDSGISFSITLNTTTNLNSIYAITTAISTTVWAVGDNGKIFKSTDGGTAFQAETTTTTNNLLKVFFVNEGLGFAVGASGTILKFTTETVPTSTSLSSEAQGELKVINNLLDLAKGETATIQYTIKNSGKVTIRIFSMQGEHLNTLLEDSREAGSYSLEWNGTDFSGAPLASGIYLVHIAGPNFSQSYKIAIVR